MTTPSDEELSRIGWAASGGQHAMTEALNDDDFEEVQRQGAAHDRAIYEAGREAGRAERVEELDQMASRWRKAAQWPNSFDAHQCAEELEKAIGTFEP